jgi:hypothetical protein
MECANAMVQGGST